MKKLTANDPKTKSPDLAADNVAKLKEMFPELVTEGPEGAAINVDVLKALVGDKTVADTEEKYGLNWHGKRRARQLALTPSTGTLRPCPEESVVWDTTQNLLIEGDNLEVLKLLQKSYAGKVKLIYIDPPYNTGKDFVYPDNFQDNIRNYLELTGQVEGGQKMSSNTEASGRFHTDWMNMMYPRLKLAYSLLAPDGAILVSIDDGEVANLMTCGREIFGDENFVANIIWEKKYSPSNDAKWLSDNHDYLVLIAKHKERWRPNLLPRTEQANARYSNSDNDSRGEWKSSGLDVKTYSEEYDYEITTPSGRVVRPPTGSCWRVGKERFQEMVEDGRIWFGQDGNNVPAIKRFLSEVKQGITPLTIWPYSEVGHNQEATKEVRALGIMAFDSPKPVRLIQKALVVASNPTGIVMDFFAGSGTTGQAVMAQNVADGGNRRYILVQLPEPLNPENKNQKLAAEFCKKLKKPLNIAELTKERLRRAAKEIREENPMFAGDLGFRVFKLDSTNIKEWQPKREDLPQTLEESVEHLKTNRSEADILYELLLKLGLDLCVPIEKQAIGGKDVHAIGGGVLIVCLAEKVTAAEVEKLGQGIVEWYKTLAPAGDTTCVFRDSAFADDVAKTNMVAILEQNGIANVWSV